MQINWKLVYQRNWYNSEIDKPETRTEYNELMNYVINSKTDYRTTNSNMFAFKK